MISNFSGVIVRGRICQREHRADGDDQKQTFGKRLVVLHPTDQLAGKPGAGVQA